MNDQILFLCLFVFLFVCLFVCFFFVFFFCFSGDWLGGLAKEQGFPEKKEKRDIGEVFHSMQT